MNWIRRVFARRRIDAELAEEIRQHLQEKVDEFVAHGMPRQEALDRARREFGNVTLLEEQARDVWRWRWFEDVIQDVRCGLRTLRRTPVLTALAIATLTLAIGANTAIFSLVHPLLFRDLPVPDPGNLVQFTWQYPGDPPLSAPGFFPRNRTAFGTLDPESPSHPRRAASMAATSIFPIVIIASNARLASSPPAAIASVSTRGVICHESPQRSLHQPHALS